MKKMLILLLVMILVWAVITIYAQYFGKDKSAEFSSPHVIKNALIVYNPDPFYDLDFQIAQSFAKGLLNGEVASTIIHCKNRSYDLDDFDLLVICANTYNYAPDWGVTNFINASNKLNTKRVVAITLGAGSTEIAAKKLNKLLDEQNAKVLASREYWLARPNDESSDDDNVMVANRMAEEFGHAMGKELYE